MDTSYELTKILAEALPDKGNYYPYSLPVVDPSKYIESGPYAFIADLPGSSITGILSLKNYGNVVAAGLDPNCVRLLEQTRALTNVVRNGEWNTMSHEHIKQYKSLFRGLFGSGLGPRKNIEDSDQLIDFGSRVVFEVALKLKQSFDKALAGDKDASIAILKDAKKINDRYEGLSFEPQRFAEISQVINSANEAYSNAAKGYYYPASRCLKEMRTMAEIAGISFTPEQEKGFSDLLVKAATNAVPSLLEYAMERADQGFYYGASNRLKEMRTMAEIAGISFTPEQKKGFSDLLVKAATNAVPSLLEYAMEAADKGCYYGASNRLKEMRTMAEIAGISFTPEQKKGFSDLLVKAATNAVPSLLEYAMEAADKGCYFPASYHLREMRTMAEIAGISFTPEQEKGFSNLLVKAATNAVPSLLEYAMKRAAENCYYDPSTCLKLIRTMAKIAGISFTPEQEEKIRHLLKTKQIRNF